MVCLPLLVSIGEVTLVLSGMAIPVEWFACSITNLFKSPAKSAELGRPYSEDQIYVRIHPPGERLNIVDRRANEDDKRRFPQQWHLFSQQKEQHPEGTQIELLYPEYPAVAAESQGLRCTDH